MAEQEWCARRRGHQGGVEPGDERRVQSPVGSVNGEVEAGESFEVQAGVPVAGRDDSRDSDSGRRSAAQTIQQALGIAATSRLVHEGRCLPHLGGQGDERRPCLARERPKRHAAVAVPLDGRPQGGEGLAKAW